jgi:hypothetical protein
MQVTGNNISNAYKMSIRIFSDGFSLYITDDTNSLLSTKHGKINFAQLSVNELKEALRSELEVEAVCGIVEISIETDCFTLIPDSLFSAGDYAALLQFQHPTFSLSSDKLLTNELLNHKAILLYSCSNKLYEAVMSVYNEASVRHHLVPYFKVDYMDEYQLHVVNRQGKLDIVAFKNNSVQLANTYEYSTDEDFLYHLTHVREQLQFADSSCSVILSGEAITMSLELLLSKHIRKIQFQLERK